MYLSEKAGFRRDLSKFKDVQGNPELTVYGVLYAFIGAGFYEEFTFRGFLMQGLAMLFGGNRGAWIGACILQGALFGAAHAYQNPLGIAITGTLGILMGLLVLASGRNLWAVIIGHGLFDASRFVLFYFQGPPTWLILPRLAQKTDLVRCFRGAPSPRRASCGRALPVPKRQRFNKRESNR